MLENLVGKHFDTLEDLKKEIENLTGEKVSTIIESESEKLEGTDDMIDVEFELFDIQTIWYQKDDVGRYYITEV
jgi:hypothetical protein